MSYFKGKQLEEFENWLGEFTGRDGDKIIKIWDNALRWRDIWPPLPYSFLLRNQQTHVNVYQDIKKY